MAAGAIVAASPLASASTCGATALECSAQETVSGVGDAVGGAGDAVSDPVGGAGDAVGGAAEAVGGAVPHTTGPVQGVTGPVQENVDKTVAEASNAANQVASSIPGSTPTQPVPPDPPGDGSTPRDGSGSATTSGRIASTHRLPSTARPRAHAGRSAAPPAGQRGLGARPNVTELSAPPAPRISGRDSSLTTSASDAATTRSLPDGELLPETLGRVLFPLLLAALMLTFLLIQDRLDRSDPKLAKAPMEGDNRLLTFR